MEWGKGEGDVGDPQKLYQAWARFCMAPKRTSKVWGLQPEVSCFVVAQGIATSLQKAWGPGEHMQLKVVCLFSPISLQKIKIANSTHTFYCYFFCIPLVCSAQEFEAG